jgi:hypothetical protein
MIGRVIDHSVYVLSAAALLLAVTFAPMRLHQVDHPALDHDALSRSLAALQVWSGGLLKISPGSSYRSADYVPADFEDELDADIEDELSVASPPVSVFFDVAPTPSPKPHVESISFVIALAARPLRC